MPTLLVERSRGSWDCQTADPGRRRRRRLLQARIAVCQSRYRPEGARRPTFEVDLQSASPGTGPDRSRGPAGGRAVCAADVSIDSAGISALSVPVSITARRDGVRRSNEHERPRPAGAGGSVRRLDAPIRMVPAESLGSTTLAAVAGCHRGVPGWPAPGSIRAGSTRRAAGTPRRSASSAMRARPSRVGRGPRSAPDTG